MLHSLVPRTSLARWIGPGAGVRAGWIPSASGMARSCATTVQGCYFGAPSVSGVRGDWG